MIMIFIKLNVLYITIMKCINEKNKILLYLFCIYIKKYKYFNNIFNE